ncbi:ribosomal protein S18 acetylase RimI-like enzyme [Actinoplanes octamycinicus]|uniref:Ribosomal protein S18 acetylase RimI-like enzyme n=1 Tax=Actinoplanes octamycinicus TaxID=135948 RepID=A0A7W7GVB2_9ACTN|nr:GNAT family N-acetyltransferase [Actinoplanes octamycinicus]MBB4738995.1 ribosomal protein S18 acetylase RimI-like enzyme [Actinoplanes octamycinicus]
MSVTIEPAHPGDPDFVQLVRLFDDYRAHYGETPEPARTAGWLSERLRSGELRAFLAFPAAPTPSAACGFVTTAVLPASLRLATFWMIRDLFVSPGQRRGGTARALLDHVVTEARAAGALRVSLQTEPDNTPALSLYKSAGFHPVDGLTNLSLPLPTPPHTT